MRLSEPVSIPCPYCGAIIEIVVDISAGDQEYIEDCEICCRPITFSVLIADTGEPRIEARGEDD